MQNIAWFIAGFVTFAGLAGMFSVPRVVLAPFVRADDTCAPPRRFTTADFIVLALYLQFALVAGTWFQTVDDGRSLQYLVTAIACVAAVLVWFGAVEAASRTAIGSELKRGLFLVVLLPATIVAMIAAGLTGPAMFWHLNEPQTALWGYGPVAWVLPIAVPSLIVGARWLGRWLVKA